MNIVPADKKSHLPVLLATAASLGIPTFTIFDADADQCSLPEGEVTEARRQKVERDRALHLSDNRALFQLAGHSGEEPIPVETVWKENLVAWKTNLSLTFSSDFAKADFLAAANAVRADQGLTEGGMDKTALFIGSLVEELARAGKSSAHLNRLCDCILEFARSIRAPARKNLVVPGAGLSVLFEVASPEQNRVPAVQAATERLLQLPAAGRIDAADVESTPQAVSKERPEV